MKRFDCFKALSSKLSDELVVANLANTSNEWRAVRPHEGNLYMVGLGMVTPYALGLALALPNHKVIAIDGDGGTLFDLSVYGVMAKYAPDNLCVIILDNKGYVSTGKWASVPTLSAHKLDLEKVIRGTGIDNVNTVRTIDEMMAAFDEWDNTPEPSVIIAETDESQAFVGVPNMDGKENKYRFVRYIEQLEGKKILRPSGREHGAPPIADPDSRKVSEEDDFATVVYEGLKENGIDFVIGLPCSGLAKAQALCMEDPKMQYIGVAHEGTGYGISAGAWLGGKKPAALVENYGLYAGAYHLMRGHYHFGIPLLLVGEYRGDAGDTEFWSKAGESTEDFLKALRINHRVVRELKDLKPAIRDGLRWLNFGLSPYAILPSFNLSRPK